ncbi:helix-turn-helix domain-containing protein [Pleomorphomonas koreensis]|uniref:helix-turn-helix domain-containing protein n=1 Tax=Pleomorphomonas koreensis TaxID=257440 RepID=UPI000410FE00|nr:helix-turn-helix transcriptional regulator [Pleomorphomonas koreensis]
MRHHRKAKGWTLEQLADQVGVCRETFGNIERGKAAPLFETDEKIAAAPGVPTPGSGERARPLVDIHGTPSRMNDDRLARAGKMLTAFPG